MEKITVKELIEFRETTKGKSRNAFAQKLKMRLPKVKPVEKKQKEGGHHFGISNAAIQNTFKYAEDLWYDSQIAKYNMKIESTEREQTKTMYQRNINIMTSFKEFPLLSLRPLDIEKFETVHTDQKIITLKDLPIYINPTLVFRFPRNGKNEIGALLLAPRLHGYKKPELGLFCEVLREFLQFNYASQYQIADDYCIAIDTFNAQSVIYTELIAGSVSRMLSTTLDELKNT